MAADETCAQCGRPLTGKDRFEGKCTACREAEALGQARGLGDEAPEQPEATRRVARRRVLLLSLVGAAVVVGVWVALCRRDGSGTRGARTGAPGASAPAGAAGASVPEAESPKAGEAPVAVPLPPRLREETMEFLALLKAQDTGRILDNYCQADEEDFLRVQRVLAYWVTGPGAAGFRAWSRVVIRLGPLKAIPRLRAAGDPHPVYTADLLTHLARDPEGSGPHVSAERRARNVLTWHLTGVYEGLDLEAVQVEATATQVGEDLMVGLVCDGTVAAERPGDDPRRLRWRQLPAGWVLRFALADRLEAIRDIVGHEAPTRNAQRKADEATNEPE